MTDTTAKIRAKGLDATGVTDQIAREMYNNLGKHYMAIVEMKVTSHAEDNDGKRSVDLVINQLEPATTEDMADHLRELTRTCYYNRGTGDQPTLTQGTDEPTVEGVLAAGAKHRPHPFLPVDAGDDNPICDVCGSLGTAPVHSQQDMLEDADDEDGDEPGAGDPQTEVDLCSGAEDCPADTHDVGCWALDQQADQIYDTTHEESVEVEEERHLSAVGDPFTP